MLITNSYGLINEENINTINFIIMDNTSSILKKKNISGWAMYEIGVSVLALVSLFLPALTVEFMGFEESTSFFESAPSLSACIVLVLFMANVVLKLFSCLPRLSSLISYLFTFFIFGIIISFDEMTDNGAKLSIGYYMLLMSFIGLLVCLLVSYISWIKNIVNYKKWFVISGLLILMGFFSEMIVFIFPDFFALSFVFLGLLFVGIVILPRAIYSYVQYRKEMNTETCVKPKHSISNVMGNISKDFHKLPHKKEIAIGAFAVITIIVGISMCSGGDKVNFEVQLPAWNKFVTVEDNVNLRQAPDANSPRLMAEEGEMDDRFVWENEMNVYGMPRAPFRVGSNVACPVLSETAEWYEILVRMGYDYDEMYTQKVYVMKKFCKEVTPQPIADSYFYKIPKGRFKGKYLYYDMGGVFAMPSSLTLGWEVDGGYVFPKMFKHEFANNGGPEEYDFSQLTNDMLEEWFGEKMKNPIQKYHIYYNFAGIGLNRYSINLMEYQGELK